MSEQNEQRNMSRTSSAPRTAMERQMDLDLDYGRIRAKLDIDAIAASGATHAARDIEQSTEEPLNQTTPIRHTTAGCRRWSRAPMAACLAAILLMSVGLMIGAGWLIANMNGDWGTSGLPPLFPWLDNDGECTPGEPSLDAPLPDMVETDANQGPLYMTTGEAEEDITLAPLAPTDPEPPGADDPSEPSEEPVTDAEQDSTLVSNDDETGPFGVSVTLDGVTYYDTGYAIPFGVLSDRLRELGAVQEDCVCYAVLGLDSSRYIVATADEHCYLYKTADAPDPAAWLEAWLGSLKP